MTAIDPIPEPTTTTKPWNDLFEDLKTRYPKVREPIVAALAVLMQDPDIDAEHAKAVAAANGFRITAASIAAAERLRSRQDDQPAVQTPPVPVAKKPIRRPRAAAPAAAVDAESLIRQVADKIQAAGSLEADRLRVAMRKAIEVLQAAVG